MWREKKPFGMSHPLCIAIKMKKTKQCQINFRFFEDNIFG